MVWFAFAVLSVETVTLSKMLVLTNKVVFFLLFCFGEERKKEEEKRIRDEITFENYKIIAKYGCSDDEL